MKAIPPSIQRLIREFNKLPGIGSKTSERFVFHLLRQPAADIDALAESLKKLKASIQLCTECYTFSERQSCDICGDKMRDAQTICVVAEPKDIIAIEKTGQYGGVYHVLGGLINAAQGIGPEQLRVEELLKRAEKNDATEVIIATDATMEGETTAVYIAEQFNSSPVQVTKIARGIPVGADIEFADEVTLGDALQGRRSVKNGHGENS